VRERPAREHRVEVRDQRLAVVEALDAVGEARVGGEIGRSTAAQKSAQ
jgi:hypothetical protein